MEPYLRVLVTLLALFVFLSVPASADSLIIVESVSELLTVDAVDGSLVFVKGFYDINANIKLIHLNDKR